MKHNKRGGLWGDITGILLILLLVAAVGFVVFRSLGGSFSTLFGIINPYEKMAGIEDEKKAPETSDCKISRVYWSKDKAKVNEKVQIIVEGNNKCNNKKVNIVLLEDITASTDVEVETLSADFSENKIVQDWIVKKDPLTHQSIINGYYFKVNLGGLESQESKRLQIE